MTAGVHFFDNILNILDGSFNPLSSGAMTAGGGSPQCNPVQIFRFNPLSSGAMTAGCFEDSDGQRLEDVWFQSPFKRGNDCGVNGRFAVDSIRFEFQSPFKRGNDCGREGGQSRVCHTGKVSIPFQAGQ